MTGSVKKHVKQAIPAYVILIVIFVVMSMVSPSFRKIGNYRNIVAQTAVLAIVSIAQCNVLLIGGIDMSVSSVISFGTIAMAMFSISRFAVKDLPEPDTPSTKPLPLSSCLRSMNSRFLDMALSPKYTP
mgnify:CR=1 FL=1